MNSGRLRCNETKLCGNHSVPLETEGRPEKKTTSYVTDAEYPIEADLAHHLINVHLPPPVRTAVDLSGKQRTTWLQFHLASDLVLGLKGSGQF